jgi:hypothetical protein
MEPRPHGASSIKISLICRRLHKPTRVDSKERFHLLAAVMEARRRQPGMRPRIAVDTTLVFERSIGARRPPLVAESLFCARCSADCELGRVCHLNRASRSIRKLDPLNVFDLQAAHRRAFQELPTFQGAKSKARTDYPDTVFVRSCRVRPIEYQLAGSAQAAGPAPSESNGLAVPWAGSPPHRDDTTRIVLVRARDAQAAMLAGKAGVTKPGRGPNAGWDGACGCRSTGISGALNAIS